jgi:hypothetical protein
VEELLEAVDAQEKDTTFTNIKAKKVNTEEEIKMHLEISWSPLLSRNQRLS